MSDNTSEMPTDPPLMWFGSRQRVSRRHRAVEPEWMPRPPRRPAALAGKIFLARTAIASKLLTPADLRSAAWRPLFRGVYADATVPIDLRHRCLAVCRYLLPAGGAVAGRSAASLYGAGTAAADDPVEIAVPRHARFGRSVGLRAHSVDLHDADVRDFQGVRVTTPARTCWDLAQWLDLVEAVVLIDMMVQRRLVSVADLQAYATGRQGHRGWRRLLRAATLADPGAESPQESRLRVRLVLAGVPAPVTQYVIERNGRFLARVDLAWPEHKVAVEYDGLWHAADDQIHRDRQRLNHLLGAGWIVLHITSKRLRDDFDTFVAELKSTLRHRTPT